MLSPFVLLGLEFIFRNTLDEHLVPLKASTCSLWKVKDNHTTTLRAFHTQAWWSSLSGRHEPTNTDADCVYKGRQR